ncbi:MAG TPA: hypothetical protein VFQ62_09155 [Methylomirabilota bacterium]|nr:hypothetical protein [Methylomirabilota bacterium]
MNVTMMLCDSVQAVNGKLYILGGGWNVTGPDPSPSAIAILVRVPWDQANRRHRLRLDLVNEDGQPVQVEGRPLQIGAEFEVGRPAGHRPGRPLNIPLGINLGPLPLAADRHFEWRCYIDDETNDDWRMEFSTRPAARQPA